VADIYKTFFDKYKSAIVLLSGGADSTAALILAIEYLGRDNVTAATCINSHFFAHEIDNAKNIAKELNVTHLTFTAEMPSEFYNGDDERCYHCKRAIIAGIPDSNEFDVVFDGTNTDDNIKERKGFRALREFGVVSPLYELGLGKDFVKKICAPLKGFSFIDESCKATRLSGEIDERRMRLVEDFEHDLKSQMPGIRYRIGEQMIEFKKPIKLFIDDYRAISRKKREINFCLSR